VVLKMEQVPIIKEFIVFPDDLHGLPPNRKI
jgi:hypothetical protein